MEPTVMHVAKLIYGVGHDIRSHEKAVLTHGTVAPIPKWVRCMLSMQVLEDH